MSSFGTFFRLGIEHILDWQGYDHMLFLLVLCAIYTIRDWRRVLFIVTAFTLGHSLTLVLATLKLVRISPDLVEFLIPATIVATALVNIFRSNRTLIIRVVTLNYFLAAVFGLIHGLGFSNYLRVLLGREQQLFGPLLGFNLGIELGQVLVIAVLMAISFVFINLLGTNRRDWNLVISAAGGGMALVLLFQAKFW